MSRKIVSPVSLGVPNDDEVVSGGPTSSKSKVASGSTIQHPLSADPPRSNNQSNKPLRRRSRRLDGGGGSGRSAPPSQQPTTKSGGGTGSQHQRSASTADAKRQQTKQLPRSVRWRLSLGLLTRPSTDSNEKEKLLKSIEDLNALKLRCQRSRYDELEKRHYWKSTPVGIANDGDGGGSAAASADGGAEGLHHVAPGDDPLSALLPDKNSGGAPGRGRREGERARKFGGSIIFGGGGSKELRKEERNRKTTPHSDSLTSVCSSNASENGGGGGNGDEAACKGSRWADFYSTREVLDVIEKDLVRLPANHYTIYHEWRMKNIGWKEHHQKEEEWNELQLHMHQKTEADIAMAQAADDATVRSDELSTLSQQSSVKTTTSSWKLGQSLNFGGRVSRESLNFGGLRKGGAFNKSVENFASLLEIGREEDEPAEQQKREEVAREEVQTSIRERAGRISQVLFVYAREHPEIGYRQGMHEVLSYVLLALEMDLLEQAIAQERSTWRRGTTSFGLSRGKGEAATGRSRGMAGVDSSGNLVVVRLLDQQYILHDAFDLFEYIMTSLAPAYDSIPTGDETAAAMLEEAKAERGESPLESMTSSIVSKIRFVARDEQLFGHVLCMPVPPQLYFAKWIRLMFGRELAGGMKNVLRLWDAFFDLASARVASQEGVPITVALLDVLKTAAASMILLIRDSLLAPTMARNGTMTGEPDPNNGIGYLMNYPPLEDISTLVEMISKLLKREQKLSTQRKAFNDTERERSLHDRHLEGYKISSIEEHPLETSKRLSGRQTWAHSANRTTPPLSADPSPSTQLVDGSDSQPREIRDGLPGVRLAGEKNDSQGRSAPKQQPNASESLGIAAEGFIDFGSRTASAAMANIQTVAVADHPLQQSNDALQNNRDEDFVIEYRPRIPETSPKQKTVLMVQMPMPMPMGEDKFEHGDLVEQLFDEGSDIASDDEGFDDDDSFASKLSVSERIGEALQKNPKEMATMLEKSVATLMNHFNEKLSTDADFAGENIGNSQHSSSMIPDEIWDAMAEIDLVRKELLQQAALTSLDCARSCSSLRSSFNSRKSKRRVSSRRQS